MEMIILAFIIIGACLYILYRNQKVYDFRTFVLKNDFEAYMKLPEYEKMLYKYWYEWDFSKFIGGYNK